jgi:hypothetical protein
MAAQSLFVKHVSVHSSEFGSHSAVRQLVVSVQEPPSGVEPLPLVQVVKMSLVVSVAYQQVAFEPQSLELRHVSTHVKFVHMSLLHVESLEQLPVPEPLDDVVQCGVRWVSKPRPGNVPMWHSPPPHSPVW